MPAAAKEEMLASLSAEEIFFLAAGVAAALKTRQGTNALRGQKPHQGIFSKNRKPRVSSTWVKWSGTHQDRSLAWSETVLGPTVYAYDGANGVEELNTAGAATARYVQGAGIDKPLARSGTALNYYSADGLGSITSLTDSTGTPAATFVYGAFGVLSSSTGTTSNPYRYTAREFDQDTGLYYYRARYYDSGIGRFLSEDPLHHLSGRNPYRYALSSPMVFVDPNGTQEEVIGKPGKPGSEKGPDGEEADEFLEERERELEALEPYVPEPPEPTPEWQSTLNRLPPKERFAVENGACPVDPKVDESLKLERYWERLTGRSPVKAGPYAVIPIEVRII